MKQKKNLRIEPNDIVGKTFHQIFIVKYLGHWGAEHRYQYKCDCGTEKNARRFNLLNGRTKSCGCLTKKMRGANSPYWRGHGEISQTFWNHIKYHANSRNLKFSISIEEAWNLFLSQNKICALSGRKLEMKTVKKSGLVEKRRTASLDRIDSAKGYVFDNVQWVHKDVNKIKMSLSTMDFIALCKEIAKYNE